MMLSYAFRNKRNFVLPIKTRAFRKFKNLPYNLNFHNGYGFRSDINAKFLEPVIDLR